ncbi:hypothetical protein BD309DRAFT_990361 [Dichomitus squalens]|uniref:Uncharacterized protein n=2 Tax=Dichomitus squalens TaxID=114155 RepID=A0A4Q9PVF5_9APHY|nr:uncharacterized protein DICSQDRAFT_175624 [Dichomitus squalens LYAD-421 SS1]EJF55690.1 hypothetical protein DICSQDRAFT_175624 [Dichomitus squalens LYAD-421 SS1]TBU44369.1 hypothetical protein BD309DRAFT_990361 [Dichomitus squalens]TBU58612.1 hypothetical protein BD310DRAFT_819034 [Dichomitus squalens]
MHAARAFEAPAIPLNWTTLSTCAVDNPARILAGDVTTVTEDNSPAACITSCAAGGFGYAGVEFGDECHCATGLKAPLDEGTAAVCDMACPGDANLSCGGVWSIQLYTVPALRPGSWAYQGCIVDTVETPAFATVTLQNLASNLDLVNQCLQACSHAGFSFAGLENASECQCSNEGITAGATKANETDCNSLCPLPGDAGFEICGGVERLGVYKFIG